MSALLEKESLRGGEGLAAYTKAFQAAERLLQIHPPNGLKTIRRLTRSLQQFPQAASDTETVKIIHDLNQTATASVKTPLLHLIRRLDQLTATHVAETRGVLVVDDDPIVRAVVKKQLSSFCQPLYVAESLHQAQHLLRHKEISLILLDLSLPDGDGRDLLLQVRQEPSTAFIPIIICSSEGGPEAKAECYALGADAYFEKPFDPLALSAAVAARLQRSLDQALQSSLDPVTRLPTRMVFYKAFNRAARIASRTGEPLSVAIVDLDRFKAVNDLSGHQAGDRILLSVATLLQQSLRESDLVIRWGGEEFVILFPNTDLAQATLALNKALTTLRQQRFKMPEGHEYQITFSGGVTQVLRGTHAEQAIAEADRYLYLAKQSGRNQIVSKEDPEDALKQNILLVEEDDFMASLLRWFLETAGYRVYRAESAQAAMALCTQLVFSLITLNVKLPDSNGYDVLKMFRQHPNTRAVPIMMLTSAGKEDQVIRGFECGADDYLLKPFSRSEFLARVQRFLRRQRS